MRFPTSSQVQRWIFAAAVVLGAGGCSDATDPAAPPRDLRIEALTSVSLTASVAAPVTPVPVVRVTDSGGLPVAGVRVEFVLAAGGLVKQREATTDGDGRASPGSWNLGTVAGPQALTAQIDRGPSIWFLANAVPGPATQVIRTAGHLQGVAAGETLSHPLRVRIADAFNNDVADGAVLFTVLSGTEAYTSTEVRSDAQGIATFAGWTPGTAPGHYQMRASSGVGQATFTATVCRTSCRNEELLILNGAALLHANLLGEVVNANVSGAWWIRPAWSADGRRVAYNTFDEYTEEYSGMFIADRDGANAWGVGKMQEPSWSPDGTQLAVSSGDCWSKCDVLLLRVNADRSVTTTTFVENAASPAWSPDGKQIAFVSLDTDNGFSQLEIMNVDGTGREALTSRDGISINRPTWSPDGERIAYGRCVRMSCDIYVATTDGSSNKHLVSNGTEPAWSPDGTWIAYTLFSPLSEFYSYIYYVAADGTSPPVQLMDRGYWAAWKPIASAAK